MKQMNFQTLCKGLKGKPSLSTIAEDISTLTSAIALLTGNPVTEGITAFIKTLAQKEKLIDLGKKVLNAILAQRPTDYSGRIEQLKEAYGTIFFTAFFDELDQQMPVNIRRSIQLSLQEKQDLFHTSTVPGGMAHLNKQEIVFPDIVYGYTAVYKYLDDMYRSMTVRLRDFVKALSFQDTAEEKEIRIFEEILNKLPADAIKRFYNQYLILCSQFNEFYIFSQMKREDEWVHQCEDRYHTILSTAMHAQDSTEAGLANLEKIIIELPIQIKEEKVREIVNELVHTYRDSINRPLIETKDEEEKLTYPLISKAFIPQAYKLLRYSGKEHLEQPDTWKNIEPEQNMMAFWAKYCLDPGSVDNLLLILGEPGGGKSLLTKILCARMIAPTNIFIRIPLREHNMEDEIESIVCRQIAKDGDSSESIPTFKWFAEEFQGNPITLLFDGYDEVMQATGGVYRNLLTKIQQFQDRCQMQRRPVRVVVTSRETLIDKADIPEKTTVMKLLEFDETRKEQWIDIWNENNHNALAEDGINDFSLPKGHKDIEELSGQPLLLLMLAIYDANFETKTNALKQKNDQAESLDRTKLYDELLRRFIRRELRKGPRGQDHSFNEADADEQIAMVDDEMKKLGIAALGMFVREKLSLKVQELEDDLVFMKAKTTNYDNKNKKILKNAEAIFGSFFFIHDSKTGNDEDETEVAFEFLHKTFYEFLVADLILQYLIDAVDDLNEIKESGKRGEVHYWTTLDNPDSLDDAYYAALNSACLCTEPEIIQMIAEWKDNKMNKFFQGTCSDFDNIMNQIMTDLFNRHTTIIRTGIFKPFIEGKGGLAGSRFYLQACAVYLMNLLVLQILISGQCRLRIEEWSYISQFLKLNAPLSKKNKPMESLAGKSTRKLRINPSEEIILKFMALFQFQRNGEDVVVSKKAKISKFERENLQEARMDVFDFIQDDVTWKVYRLHDAGSPMNLKQQYRQDLQEQGFDLDFELIIAQLHQAVLDTIQLTYHELEHIVQIGIRCLHQNYGDASLVLDWLLCLRLLIDKMTDAGWPLYVRDFRETDSWEELAYIILRQYPDQREIMLTFLGILKKLDPGRFYIKNRWINEILIYQSRISPDVFVALVEASPYNIIDRIPLHEIDYASSQLNLEYIQHMNSPKKIAAFLELLYTDGTISSFHPIWNKIQKNWAQYLRTSPEDLPELLQTYLQIGKFKEVKYFFQHIDMDKICKLLAHNPKSLSGFLSVAQTVREDRNFREYIANFIEKKSASINVRWLHPQVIMRLLHCAVLDKYAQTDIPLWIDIFIHRYNEMFNYDPEEAVLLLTQISINTNNINNWRSFSDICIYSLQHYRQLLNTSVKATARLLTLLERMIIANTSDIIPRIAGRFESRENDFEFLAFYVTLCFNKAMSVQDKTAISSLAELLDNMSTRTKAELAKYFKDQCSYLRAYSWTLAEKVAKIYGLT